MEPHKKAVPNPETVTPAIMPTIPAPVPIPMPFPDKTARHEPATKTERKK